MPNKKSKTPTQSNSTEMEILEAALREVDAGEAIIDEHVRVLCNIATALKTRKLARLPKQRTRPTTTLSPILEKVLELQKAKEEETLGDDELKREAKAVLELIRQAVKELNTGLATAKAIYRPIERARGH